MDLDKMTIDHASDALFGATDSPQRKPYGPLPYGVWTCVVEVPKDGTRIRDTRLEKVFDELWENRESHLDFFLFNNSALSIATEDGNTQNVALRRGHYVSSNKGVYVPRFDKPGFMWMRQKPLTMSESKLGIAPLSIQWIPSFPPFSTRFDPPLNYDQVAERASKFCSTKTDDKSMEPNVTDPGRSPNEGHTEKPLVGKVFKPEKGDAKGRVVGKMFDIVMEDTNMAAFLQSVSDRLGLQTVHQLHEFCRSLDVPGREHLIDLSDNVDFDDMGVEVYNAFMSDVTSTSIQDSSSMANVDEQSIVSTPYFRFRAKDPTARCFLRSACEFFKFRSIDKLKQFLEAIRTTRLDIAPAVGYHQLTKEARLEFAEDVADNAIDDDKYCTVESAQFCLKVKGTKMAKFLQKAIDSFGLCHIEQLQRFVIACVPPKMDMELNNLLNAGTHRHTMLKRRKEEYETMQAYATKVARDNKRLKIELEKAQELLKQYESNKENIDPVVLQQGLFDAFD